jgi:hypothetical protein
MRRALVALAALGLIACGTGPSSILEAGPRVPDEEGTVVDASFERLVLDGGRAFRIHPEVESFTTRAHEPTSLLAWQGKYVHLGLDDDDRVVWVAGIGVVRVREGIVLYTGVLEGVDEEGRLVFEDGTVFRSSGEVDLPELGIEVLVELDPETQQATDVRVQ